MQNLWKKESHRGDAILIDLLAEYRKSGAVARWNHEFHTTDCNHRIQSKTVKPFKNNKVSDEFRNEGNVFYRANKWKDAIKWYNHALRFAQVGTRSECFVYGNRSACFLELKQYNECLVDIELAIKANFPKNLMSVLIHRKAKCEELMKCSKTTITPKPKLDFNSNENFPCMADVLEIKHNEEFGRHIVALKDIDACQTVLVEKSKPLHHINESYCYGCLEMNKNFIACSKCTDVMFCSVDCQNTNQNHYHFCGSSIHRMAKNVKFIAKSILVAMKIIPNVDELVSFVDGVISNRAWGVHQAVNDRRLKYDTFLSLQPAHRSKYDMKTIFMVYIGLMDIPNIKSIFCSEERQRFLIHLIVEHAFILSNNSSSSCMEDLSTFDTAVCVSSFFNHACEPNVFKNSTENHHVYITMMPIKKGQQLYINYSNGDQTTRERQMKLSNKSNFHCKCSKCGAIKSARFIRSPAFASAGATWNDSYDLNSLEINSTNIETEYESDPERDPEYDSHQFEAGIARAIQLSLSDNNTNRSPNALQVNRGLPRGTSLASVTSNASASSQNRGISRAPASSTYDYDFEADTWRAIQLSLMDNNNNQASNVPQSNGRLSAPPPSRRESVASASSMPSQPHEVDIEKAKALANSSKSKGEITFDWSICMEFNDQDVIVATECGHLFHDKCVTPWIKSTGNCPTCRVQVAVASLRKIFISVNSDSDLSASASTCTPTAMILNSNNNNSRNCNNMSRCKTNARGTTLPTMFSRSIWLSSFNKQMTEISMATYIAQKFNMPTHNFSVKSLQKGGARQSLQPYVSFKVSVDSENTFNTLIHSGWPSMFRVREFIQNK